MEEAEKTIGLAAHELERRGMPRCLVDEEAALLVVSRGATIPGRMVELSASGCRLVLKDELPRGIHAAVEVSWKMRGMAFRLGGLTEWTSGGLTVGVSFGPMNPRRRDDLLEVLCEVGAEQASKGLETAGSTMETDSQPIPANGKGESFQLLNAVFRRAPKDDLPDTADRAQPGEPVKAGETPGADSCAGGKWPLIATRAPLAVEKAMRRPATGSETGAETGKAAGDLRGLAQPPSRRERRIDARCGVDTSAVIHLVKSGSRLAGQIRDLSLGGCRIHSVEKFPVGIYTRVEVEFRLQGTPLLLGGVVQAIHGRSEVGIRFLDVSPRKREHVAELIAEIREMRGEMQSSAEAG